jgi:hypothetical protein
VRFFDDLMFKNSQETQRTECLTKKRLRFGKKTPKNPKNAFKFCVSEMQNALRFLRFSV